MTIRRGDILWADLGMFPTTSVQGGVRPVIVVSNNKANTWDYCNQSGPAAGCSIEIGHSTKYHKH